MKHSLFLATLLLLASCSGNTLTPDQKLRPVGMVAVFNLVDWQTVLTRIVTPAGYVRWSQFDDAKSAARPALERFLAELAVVSPDNRPDLFEVPADRKAYWINAYNAACIYGELLRQKALPTNALYEQDRFLFGGHSLTLREVENNRLDVASDPRLLFALNRCTKSSPPLRDEPYLYNHVKYQLNDQAARCLSDKRFVVIHNGVASLNQKLILDHQHDFLADLQSETGKTGSLLDALRFLAGARADRLTATRWDSLPYDAALNTPQ